MNVLIILPVHNETENLPGLVKRILSINKDLKVLIIDDNSTDNSFEVSMHLKRENPQQIFFIKRNGLKGRGATVIEGYKFAIFNNFDYVIEMDADLSHLPEYTPLFLQEAKDVDMVIGSRYIAGGKIEGRPRYRNIISYLANVYLRFLLGLRKIRDVTSGYRCINGEFLKRLDLDLFESKGPELLQEIIFRNKERVRIKEIPIVFKERAFGKTKFSFFMASICLLAPLRWQITNSIKLMRLKFLYHAR